jgi:beta-glucan synthesis-associated protein KRE6
VGNLGRPGYKATTEGRTILLTLHFLFFSLSLWFIPKNQRFLVLPHSSILQYSTLTQYLLGVWPYTYNSCDAGITPNQSSPDGISHLPGQKLPSCTCDGEDHPNPGTGRGAPEIDILEASVDPTNRIGVVTQSFQVAPFDVYYRPNSDFLQIPNYNTTSMNGYCGGPFQQAISGTTLLNNNWYDGNQYQKYAFEYEPGTSQGKIAWFVGEDRSFMMDGRAVGQNGNVAPRVVSEEPMSLVMNLGISTAWGMILIDQLKFPTVMRIDYVRIYQRPGNESITCDPPGYPTTDYIKKHPVAYNNPNLTVSLSFSVRHGQKLTLSRRGMKRGINGQRITCNRIAERGHGLGVFDYTIWSRLGLLRHHDGYPSQCQIISYHLLRYMCDPQHCPDRIRLSHSMQPGNWHFLHNPASLFERAQQIIFLNNPANIFCNAQLGFIY